jgi:CRISPR/Cas system CSM-associated protein Csm3 (group 7 of RAMP superfamily)
MNTKIEFELLITPLSQFHIGTGFGIGRFIDRATIKDKLGAIYIPGSTIKGKAKYFALCAEHLALRSTKESSSSLMLLSQKKL